MRYSGSFPIHILYVFVGILFSGLIDMSILLYVFAFGMVVLGPLFLLVILTLWCRVLSPYVSYCPLLLGSSLGGHSIPLAHLTGASFCSPLGCSVLVQFSG